MTTQKNYRRFVAAIDMTEQGDNALREAMALAQKFENTELHVVYVLETSENLHDAAKIDALNAQLDGASAAMKRRVTEVCAPSEGEFRQNLVMHVRLGEPAKAIHQVAVDVDADMVVVGTHKRTGLRRLIEGSTAEKLLQIAQLPIIVAVPKALEDLKKTDQADPARPGEDLTHQGVITHETMTFRPRATHVAGMI